MTAACPVCKAKLWLNDTMRLGAMVGCVNCNSDLRVISRRPDKLEAVPESETHNADSKPESYA